MTQRIVSKRCQSIDEILNEKHFTADKFDPKNEFENILNKSNSYVYKLIKHISNI